jgi:hypothetical protein
MDRGCGVVPVTNGNLAPSLLKVSHQNTEARCLCLAVLRGAVAELE